FRIGNTQRKSGETTYNLQLSGDTFRRDGYVLTGWNTERDGSGTAYGADQRIVFGSTDANGSNWKPYETSPRRLYAQWAKAPSHTVPIPLDMQRLAEPDDTILVAVYDTDGRTKIFRSAVSRDDVVSRETHSLLDRAYQGSIGLMLSAMVHHKDLTKADIDELYAILKEAEEDAK
ncbi:MAG: BlaI/MecI/CopY family transcriptional regulator, partial [Oscillospiraceae bacterium]|nr:BlaI/MecI/CopY family transcriptional regulator [Oscillospiraceae bacterium]